MVRLSHSHIRIGTFQRLAYLRDEETMRRLVGYVLDKLYDEPGDDPVRLLSTSSSGVRRRWRHPTWRPVSSMGC